MSECPDSKGAALNLVGREFDNDTAENVGVKIPVSSFFFFLSENLV